MGKILTFIFVFIGNVLTAQSIYFQNGSKISLVGGAGVFVQSNSSNDIQSNGGGFYVTDNNVGYVEWNIQSSTGNYEIPFVSTANEYVPIAINITSGGVGSTVKVSNIDIPSNFPNFSDPNSINRYWTLDFDNYTTLPIGSVQLTFSYYDVPTYFTNVVLKYYKDVYSGVWTNNELATYNIPSNINLIRTTTLPINQYLNTLNSNHKWTLVNPISALPVTLLFFKGENKENKYSHLTWETALEINNSGFIVERSLNAMDFDSIGWVNGHGNATTLNTYSFDDINILNGKTYYYRLKQVDFDGEFEYSDMVSVRFDGQPETIEYYNLIGQKIDDISSQNSGVYIKVINKAPKLIGLVK